MKELCLVFGIVLKPMITCVKLLLIGGPVALPLKFTVVSQQCLSVSMSLLRLQEDFLLKNFRRTNLF